MNQSHKGHFTSFIPYQCYSHNEKFITVFAVCLKPFKESAVSFKLNEIEVENVTKHSEHQAFKINPRVNASILKRSEDQSLQLFIGGLHFHHELIELLRPEKRWPKPVCGARRYHNVIDLFAKLDTELSRT
eukprot:GFKZ01013311.1.p1 GENE.GFKZ01013311.1~~GFKZ01013311.1.p1  ORF type:complete len:131 (-),score=10.27 GFKZ01013311.1:147-539(-)